MFEEERRQNQKLHEKTKAHSKLISEMQKVINEWRETMKKQCEDLPSSTNWDIPTPFGEDKNYENMKRKSDSVHGEVGDPKRIEANGTSNENQEIVNPDNMVEKARAHKLRGNFPNKKVQVPFY